MGILVSKRPDYPMYDKYVNFEWRKLGGGSAWCGIFRGFDTDYKYEARTRSNRFGGFFISQVPSSSPTNDLGKGYLVNGWLCYLSANGA